MKNTSLGEFWFQKALNNWETEDGLIYSALFITFIATTSYLTGIVTNLYLLGIAFGLSLPTLVLFWRRGQVRIKKSEIGIGIAIHYEDNPELKKLCNDFILAMKGSLDGIHIEKKVRLGIFPQAVATKAQSYEEAFSLSQKASLDFLIYGKARTRNIDGYTKNVLDLHGLARHVHIDSNTSQGFSQELSSGMPSRVLFDVNADIFKIEFVAKHIEGVSKYVIGIINIFACNYDAGEKFLIAAKNDLRMVKLLELKQFSNKLINSIEQHLERLYHSQIQQTLRDWRQSPTESIYRRIDSLLLKLSNLSKGSEVLKAVCIFTTSRNLTSAYHHLEAYNNKGDHVWLMNMAFLKGYENKLQDAHKYYNRAFLTPCTDATVLAQTEEYIQTILIEEPDKYGLYFCSGILNYKAKGDLDLAERDFQNFLKACPQNKHQKHRALAERWLNEIKNKLATAA